MNVKPDAMKPEQLLQDLINGELSPAEFKRRAFQPSGHVSPAAMRNAFRVPVTSEGRHLDTGEEMAEWLPRLKRERGTLRVVNMGVTWAEWQAFLNEDEEEDYFELMEEAAAEMGMSVPELQEWLKKNEYENSTLY